MNTIKNTFNNVIKAKSTYFLLATALFDLVALILYLNFGTSIFIAELSTTVIVLMILGIILPFAVVFSPLKIPYVILYVVNLLACFYYLSSQASFIANVFVGIDGSSFPVPFYLIVITTLASAVLSLVTMTFIKEEKLNETEDTSNQSVEGEQI